MRRFIACCLSSLLLFSLAAQENSEWENDYHRYHGSYEDNFPCTWVLSGEQRDSLDKTYCGSMSLTLTREGTYSITLTCYQDAGGKVEEIHGSFMGTYLVNGSGEVTLNGPHPFDTNKLHIHEMSSRDKGKKYLTGRGFKYRFGGPYNRISKKRLYTYCDGCQLNPED